jgi:hypothetical protein
MFFENSLFRRSYHYSDHFKMNTFSKSSTENENPIKSCFCYEVHPFLSQHLGVLRGNKMIDRQVSRVPEW